MGKKLSKIKAPKFGNKQPATATPPGPPYLGPSAKYHFMNCEAAIKHHINFGFMSNSIVTSNIDVYYPLLVEHQAQGLKLLTFYRIPGQARRGGGFANPEVLVLFQGILCSYPSEPSSVEYEIRVEKSVIQPEIVMTPFMTMRGQVNTDTQHLFQTLARYADMGARLICIEITGQETHTPGLMRRQMPALGCDLFFDVPIGKVSEKYIYTVICVPIGVTCKPGFIPKVEAQCDWMGNFSQYLNQGWKLVEIFYDKNSNSKTSGFTACAEMNSQWYFEKPASRAEDSTPTYEGTIVEHEIKIRGGTTTTAWEPVIQNMGNFGWELACILELPESRCSVGLIPTIYQKTLLFFQRKILSSSLMVEAAAASAPPPPYPAEDFQDFGKDALKE